MNAVSRRTSGPNITDLVILLVTATPLSGCSAGTMAELNRSLKDYEVEQAASEPARARAAEAETSGDQAAAIANWKAAMESYAKAVEVSTSARRDKYETAKSKAIAQALAVAERCLHDGDFDCVDSESAYVQAVERANAQAATLRAAGRENAALAKWIVHVDRRLSATISGRSN